MSIYPEQKIVKTNNYETGKILLVLIEVLFTSPAMAQTGVTVTGRIVERGIFPVDK